MEALLCVFTALLLGQEAALTVSRVPIGPPSEAVEKKFNAACAEYVDVIFRLS